MGMNGAAYRPAAGDLFRVPHPVVTPDLGELRDALAPPRSPGPGTC
jgi:hypothetical protein